MIDISKVKDDKETILRLRRIWWGMKTRCYNKNDKHYKNYGARGISISDEWLIFENFKIGLAEIHYVFSIVNECEYK